MDSKVRGTTLWLLIFIAGAVFQLWRGSPVDTVIYLVVALLVILSSLSSFKIPGFRSTRFSSWALLLLIATLGSSLLPIHSWPITTIYLMLVPVIIRIAWPRDLPTSQLRDDASRRSSMIWSAIGILVCICELGNYFASDYTHNDKAYPTITVLVDPIVANAWGKVVFVLIWAGIGAGLFRVSTKR